MELFDSHCHFDFAAFAGQQTAIWQQCQQAGIRQLLIPGISPEQWFAALQSSHSLHGVYTACGLHPWWVGSFSQTHCMAELTGLMQNFLAENAVIAIGECGLDKLIDTPMALQQDAFEQQIALACKLNLPLVVHVRKTHNETLYMLRHFQPPAGGVIHGFSGSTELARQYWQMGFYLGIGGTITYDRAKKTRQAVCDLPLEALLLETDAPDMPVQGQQGQANSPLNLPKIARTLAELRHQDFAAICQQTTANCKKLFNLP